MQTENNKGKQSPREKTSDKEGEREEQGLVDGSRHGITQGQVQGCGMRSSKLSLVKPSLVRPL